MNKRKGNAHFKGRTNFRSYDRCCISLIFHYIIMFHEELCLDLYYYKNKTFLVIGVSKLKFCD